MADTPRPRICLCLLPAADEVLGWVPAFAAHLEQRGIQLLVLRVNDNGCAAVHVPGSAAVDLHIGDIASRPPFNDQALVERIIQSGFGPADEAGTRAMLTRVAAVAGHLCDTLAPEAVLLWSDVNPKSRALRSEFDRRRVPAWFFERGFFPDTLMVESAGQGALSELKTSFALSHVAASVDGDVGAFKALREYVINRATPKWPQGARLTRETLRDSYAPADERLVLFLGQWDAAGLWPSWSPERRRHSPGFESTEAAFNAVSAACKRILGCRVVFKPHPISVASGRVPKDAVQMPDVHLYSAIDAADVVVGQLTTSMFEAVLLEKPVVSLGRGVLAERGITYDSFAADDLEKTLRAALARDRFAERLERASQFVTWLARHFLIGTNEDVPGVRPLADLAAFVDSCALPPEGRSFEARWHTLSPSSYLLPSEISSRSPQY
jgi:hypothetical protein